MSSCREVEQLAENAKMHRTKMAKLEQPVDGERDIRSRKIWQKKACEEIDVWHWFPPAGAEQPIFDFYGKEQQAQNPEMICYVGASAAIIVGVGHICANCKNKIRKNTPLSAAWHVTFRSLSRTTSSPYHNTPKKCTVRDQLSKIFHLNVYLLNRPGFND